MKRLWLFLLIVLASLFFSHSEVYGSIEDEIKKYEQKITDLKQEETTLSKQISLFDSQISLTSLRINTIKTAINKLTSEISELAGEIERLEELLTRRTELVLRRIPESYKRRSTSQFGLIFLSSSFSDFIARVKYIATVQEKDAALLFQLKATQNNFAQRKDLREQKKLEQEKLKKELERQSTELTRQKKDKQILLEQTKNSEIVYQQLLTQARAEQQAIAGIIAGRGVEVKAGDIKAGDRIASIINGRSCNSSGAHLHFIVEKSSAPVNPFSYLKGIAYDNCSGERCGDPEGDPFNPNGSWDWPIEGPIKLTQGYGNTWAIRHTWVGRVYSFHNGIDISGSSLKVAASQPGVLFRGTYSGINGCSLQYVKVEHSDSNLRTYYLHVNY